MRYPNSDARSNTRRCHITMFAALLIVAPGSAVAGDVPLFLSDDPIGVPMRVRNFTYPTLFFLGFAPAPAAPLGQGTVAIELHYSKINYFQTSPSVESYLRQSRHGGRRELDSTDVDAIASMPAGEGFYLDGEIDYTELFVHWGLTDRLDLSVAVPYIGFSGGILDGLKWATKAGVFGVGLTENLFNFSNTPDIGIHLSWGNFFGRSHPKEKGVAS
jgi:hypothetical protein